MHILQPLTVLCCLCYTKTPRTDIPRPRLSLVMFRGEGSRYFQDSLTWPSLGHIQDQAKESMDPCSLHLKELTYQFLSISVSCLFLHSNYLQIYTFILLIHYLWSGFSARQQDSYGKVPAGPQHPQFPARCMTYNICSISASWMLIHEAAGPEMQDIKSYRQN